MNNSEMKYIIIHDFPYYYHIMKTTYVNVPHVSDQLTTKQSLGSILTPFLHKVCQRHGDTKLSAFFGLAEEEFLQQRACFDKNKPNLL